VWTLPQQVDIRAISRILPIEAVENRRSISPIEVEISPYRGLSVDGLSKDELFLLEHNILLLMAIRKDKKKEIVARIKDVITSSNSVVFVNFHGVNVADTTELRNGLRENNVGYLVAKKTLVRKVLEGTAVNGAMPTLDGEIALAYGEDMIAPAREVFAFQSKHKEGIAILGGVFEGGYMDKGAMTAIASIPPVNVLYGQFVNLINSPIQRFVSVLGQIMEHKV